MVSQNTQLVPQNGQQRALATPTHVALEGMDDFTTADLELPVLKIVHGVSRMEGADDHIGQLWNSISGEFHKTIDVVILNGRHSRSLFSGDSAESDRPECVSRDGVIGSTYGTCSQCQFNPEFDPTLWNDKSSKRCNKGFTLFLYMPEQDEFAVFTASKTNVQPIRRLNTQIALRHKAPLFGVIVTLSTEKHEEAGKKWYVLAPKIKRALSPDEVSEYRQMSAALRGMSVKIVDEEVPAASAEASADDEPPVASYEEDAPPARNGDQSGKQPAMPF